MTFENLPRDWPDRPLGADPLTADVVDLFAKESDRDRRTLLLLLCDESGRLLQPVAIDDLPETPDDSLVDGLSAVFEHFPVGSLGVVAAVCLPFGRPGDATPRAWHLALERVTREAGMPLLGCYLATPGRVTRTSLPLAA